MKRLLLSVFLLSMVAFYGFSQRLTLSNIHGTLAPNASITQAGTPDSVELITYLNVKNTSDASADVYCKKVELTLVDSNEVSMCWAGGCTGSDIFVSPNSQPIHPGETNTEFSGHYTQVDFNHLKTGESIVRWVFYDRAYPDDSACVTVTYAVHALGIEEANAPESNLSNAYPNPANGLASCSYSFPAGSEGTILVRDLLGSSVQTQVLPAAAGKVTLNTSNLGDGIYFCSLLVNGKISQTKKLVVKH
jgi:hypothetical protein